MMSAELATVWIPVLALLVAAGGLWMAGKQLSTSGVQATMAAHANQLNELQLMHSSRLSTMTATIEDLKQEIGSLEVMCRLNQQHAERCEAELARLRSSGGFRHEGGI